MLSWALVAMEATVGQVVDRTWDASLVALSVACALFGSWTTLVLVDAACTARGLESNVLVFIASLAMGVSAVWSSKST